MSPRKVDFNVNLFIHYCGLNGFQVKNASLQVKNASLGLSQKGGNHKKWAPKGTEDAVYTEGGRGPQGLL